MKRSLSISVLRADKIHPVISGNKWFKLKYYLEEARQLHKKNIVTFGGSWSNHVVAIAAACRLYGFTATSIIRGEESAALSPTLQQAKEMGMHLVFINRGDYRKKEIPAGLLHATDYLIPEGGYGIKGAEGAGTMLEYCMKEKYTHIACAAGTGTMLAGLINVSLPHQEVIGIPVLKNKTDLEKNITSLLKENKKKIRLFHDYHFGGYARHTPALLSFMNDFYMQTAIPSDFVYTGKLFFAITDLITKKIFPPGSNLLLLHSGGLQGNQSLDKGTLIF